MNDPIERQAAIDAMTNTLWHYPNECYRNLNEYEFAKGLAELGLKSVPSAQPEYTESEKEMLSMMFSIFDQTLSAWYLEINHENFSRTDLYYLAKKLGIDYD